MNAVEPRILADIPLFKGLGEGDLKRLATLLRRKLFPADSLIITAEQPGEAVYVILDGTVKIFLSREDGTEVILAILGPGQTVGEMSLVDSVGRSANVVTMEKTEALWLDGTSFRQVLKTIPGLSYNLITLLSGRLRVANEQIQALSALDVAGRVARQILAFADQYGRSAEKAATVRIPLRLTQGDIAAIVGTSRERVNQVMVQFKRQGYISVDDAYHISVLDRDSLTDRCR
jgi:CRP/FNR family cyclic AMP-dependent transcriptional regulator